MFGSETRVLVIDDTPAMRKIVLRVCKDLGFTQLTDAADGAEGWEKLSASAGAIDLVVSDWNMPNMKGIDLLRRIRADERFKNIPFVMLSAESDQSQIQEAASAGADSYLLKPFTASAFKETLETISKKRAA